jgi:hypothetical protein
MTAEDSYTQKRGSCVCLALYDLKIFILFLFFLFFFGSPMSAGSTSHTFPIGPVWHVRPVNRSMPQDRNPFRSTVIRPATAKDQLEVTSLGSTNQNLLSETRPTKLHRTTLVELKCLPSVFHDICGG